MSHEPKPTSVGLLDAISKATDADLDAIDNRVDALEKELAKLRAARKAVALILDKTPPKTPPSARQPPNPDAVHPKTLVVQGRRAKIAKHLIVHGPRSAADLANWLQVTMPSIYFAVDHPWFSKADGKVYITPAGRQAND